MIKFLLLLEISVAWGRSMYNTDIAKDTCPCDVTPNICDQNCCCDSQCGEWLSVWQQDRPRFCKEYRPLRGRALQKCDELDYDLMDTFWKPFADAFIWATCIYFDRSPKKFGAFYNAYTPPSESTQAIDFSSLQRTSAATTSTGVYQAGDVVQAMTTTRAASSSFTMRVPTKDSSGKCVFVAPITFSLASSNSYQCDFEVNNTAIPTMLNPATYSAISILDGPGGSSVALDVTGAVADQFIEKVYSGNEVDDLHVHGG
eukprot:TRINITY_DN9581_c0_g3_i1.p1 TRINITY_DN9581_c0_g3~~TRINITY_DN9581_c0_g3_i1.p1  ORF type:complete len:258 (-),score=32.03 TRINITY_DN9581_c0_g3_i1:167-940(-)